MNFHGRHFRIIGPPVWRGFQSCGFNIFDIIIIVVFAGTSLLSGCDHCLKTTIAVPIEKDGHLETVSPEGTFCETVQVPSCVEGHATNLDRD